MNILDPEWRLNNLYKIVTKSGDKVTFEQNSVQKKLNTYKQKRRRILKARQMGISTNELLKMLDFVLFNKNKTAVILAHEQDSIQKLFRIVRRAYDFLPPMIKPAIDRGGGSQYSMFFPSINSRIYCDLESRGDTIHYLHVSEKAFISDISRVYATIEAVPIDGIITEETTPFGFNHFYDSWTDPISNYENIFLPWFFHYEYKIESTDIKESDYSSDEKKLIEDSFKNFNFKITPEQIAFRRFKQNELKEMFIQEYPENDISCFLTTGQNPFNLSILKPLYDKAKKPLKIINGVKIYKERQKDSFYVIGADTAEGFGGDQCAAHVFDIKTKEQVATFSSNTMKPGEFADKLYEIANLYKSIRHYPLLAVERNNHGHAVLLKLDEVLYYPNLFKHTKDKIGWITDASTRPIMVNTLIESIENGTITINDRETLGECLTLVNKSGKIQAENNKHDDLFIAACISFQLCIEESKSLFYSDSVHSFIRA